MANVAKKLADMVSRRENRPTTYTGTVVSVGGRYRVLLDGATEPTLCLPEVKAVTGDRVTVEIRNHAARVSGNITHPTTDDAQANEALTQASVAADAATQAQTAAGNAATAASSAQTAAQSAITAAGNAQSAATSAATAASNAQASANTANQAASTALVNLAVIEDVAGTLTWISEHGSYVLTTDTTVQDGTVYFELVSGDYVPIATPDPSANPSQEGWYVLDVTDSQSDYIMAHLAVTSAGLWVLPSGIDGADAQHSTGYKALLASSGMSIFDGSGMIVASYGSETAFYDGLGNAAANIVAKFGRTGSRIGYESEGHVEVTPGGMKVAGSNGAEYSFIGTVNDPDTGIATVVAIGYCNWQVDGSVYGIEATAIPISVVSAKLNGADTTAYIAPVTPLGGQHFGCIDAVQGDLLEVTFTTSDVMGRMSFGEGDLRADGRNSFAHGDECVATGANSHAEGRWTRAYGENSHASGVGARAIGRSSTAEGSNNDAFGDSSHVGGSGSIADGRNSFAHGSEVIAASTDQVVLGHYNVKDDQDTYALIVGNGSYGNRSNALAVGWDGGLYVNNHAGAIGEVVTNDISTAVSVPDSTWTSIGTVTLSAGVWILEQHGIFPSNATGRRAISSSTTADSAGNATEQRQAFTSQQATNGTGTGIDASRVLNLASSATLHLNVYQNSGNSLNVTGFIRAVRIR